jgi:hypothetical protein
MLYIATVTIKRRTGREPAGLTALQITAEIDAVSWSDAADQATETVLDDHVHGGLAGSEIVSVELRRSTV